MSEYGRKSLWPLSADGERAVGLVREDSTAKSTSIAPLFTLYCRAWDRAQADGTLLKRLEHAVEARTLSQLSPYWFRRQSGDLPVFAGR